MKNSELVRDFVQGETEGRGSNLYIKGNELINYTTTIAFRYKGYVIINSHRYSSTTSVHQNRLRNESGDGNYLEVPTENLFNVVIEELEVPNEKGAHDLIICQLNIMQNTLMDTSNYTSKKAKKESYDFEVKNLTEYLAEIKSKRLYQENQEK